MVKVKAKRMGYYDYERRREGDVFEVPEELLSAEWMERLDGKPIYSKLEKKDIEPAKRAENEKPKKKAKPKSYVDDDVVI